MRRFPVLPIAMALLLAGATGNADGRGPADGPAPIATLRIEAADGEYLAWADNNLAGPVEVRLEATAAASPPSDPPLPARASVPARASALVARLRPPGNGSLPLRLLAVPGSSNARPRDVAYLPPLRQPAPRIDQGFEGGFSHSGEEHRYALDFATPVGTPVHAARGGTVMQVEAGFHEAGLEDRHAGRANLVRILHDDGSMALYAHLTPGGVVVAPGQRVRAGQQIGLSGNTGYSTAPHLHFAVQVNRGGRLVSIPFRMPGVAAPP